MWVQIDRIIAKDYWAAYIARRLILIRTTNRYRLSINSGSVTHSLRMRTQRTGSACRLEFGAPWNARKGLWVMARVHIQIGLCLRFTFTQPPASVVK